MKKVVLILVMSLFLFSMVSATEIIIKTIPFGVVNINVLNPESSSFDLLQRLTGNTTNYGDLVLSYSPKKDVVNMIVSVKKNGVQEVHAVFKEIDTTGSSIELLVVPEGFVPLEDPNIGIKQISNETDNSTEESDEEIIEDIVETEEVVEEEISITTGQSIIGLEKLSKYKYYFIGILAVGALAFLVIKFGNHVIPVRGKKPLKKKSDDSPGKIDSLMKRLQKDEDEIKRLEGKKDSSENSSQ